MQGPYYAPPPVQPPPAPPQQQRPGWSQSGWLQRVKVKGRNVFDCVVVRVYWFYIKNGEVVQVGESGA